MESYMSLHIESCVAKHIGFKKHIFLLVGLYYNTVERTNNYLLKVIWQNIYDLICQNIEQS